MADVTYYAIVDDHTTRTNPAGVLRRFNTANQRDESFGRDLEWKFSALWHAVEHGDTEYTLVPISEAEAELIVERLRGAT